ncbi:MAG: dehydrogenase [Planctomyces sp.]|jgi:predicted dehydrogenase|nr:dehydrogenase [Planctomyces sp.]MDP7276991.1 Gfo/Idh/MocA family oxidoreductase [Planctomycetaceae bacterium]
MTDPTRRNFLQASGAALLAANAKISSGAFAGGNETIKIGLIGCGGRGTGAAAQALATEGPVQLVAMADAFGDQLERSLKRITNSVGPRKERVAVTPERRFTGFDAYKKLIASDVDLVIMATPPAFRPTHFAACVDAGKHVFMEKPVATDAPGIRQVIAATELAKKKQLAVGVGLQRHHQNTYLETMKRIKDGAIGDIVSMRCYWNSGGVWDPRRTRKQCKGEMEYQMRNWYYYTWLCGDHIVEQHIHNLDVCNWLMDGYPVVARGMGGRQVRTDKKYGEIFDHFAVQYEYADGTPMFSQCRHIRNCWNSVSEHAHGSKGYANISGASLQSGQSKWRYRGKRNNPYQTEHDHLFAAIRSGKAGSYNEGERGAYSTLTAILGRVAVYGGKPVTWDKVLNSKISLVPQELAWNDNPPTMPDELGAYPIPVPGVTQVV